jgi:hypothetical protein
MLYFVFFVKLMNFDFKLIVSFIYIIIFQILCLYAIYLFINYNFLRIIILLNLISN